MEDQTQWSTQGGQADFSPGAGTYTFKKAGDPGLLTGESQHFSFREMCQRNAPQSLAMPTCTWWACPCLQGSFSSVLNTHLRDHPEPPDQKAHVLAHTYMLLTTSPRYAMCESQAVMMVKRKANIWSSPNNESYSWKKRNPYSWQLFSMKFLNCCNININSMEAGKKKMSEKCGIWLPGTM